MQKQQEKMGKPATLVLLGVLGSIAGVLFPITLLMTPALWAYVMCKWKPVSLAIFGVLFAALDMLLLGAFNGACLAVLAIGMAAALYLLQTKKLGNAYTVATMAGVSLVALYALLCLPGILNGEGAFAAIQRIMDESAESFRMLVEAMGTLPEESATQMVEAMDAYKKVLPTLVVPTLVILSSVLALANFLFFRMFARKQGLDIQPLRVFRLWSIPRSMTGGLLTMLLGALVIGFTDWEYADALMNAINAIVGMPLLLQGLCVLDFLLSKKQDGKVTTRRVLTYLVTGLLLVIVQTPLIMLGCFDQIFRFRTRTLNPPPMQL